MLMTLREKRTFTVFTAIYTILIFLTSIFIELTIADPSTTSFMFVLIFFGTSLLLSILYAWILVSRKKRVWATFKCIGYTSRDVISLISGILIFTMTIGLFIVIEIMFHYAAGISYLASANINFGVPPVLVGLVPVIVTSGIFLLVQVISIVLIYQKVLKVRPIIALKKVGQ